MNKKKSSLAVSISALALQERESHERAENQLSARIQELVEINKAIAARETDLKQRVKQLEEIERKAIEQSETVQRDWASPVEVAGMKKHIAEIEAAAAWVPVATEPPQNWNRYIVKLENKFITIARWSRVEDASRWLLDNSNPVYDVIEWRELPQEQEEEGAN